VEAADGPLGALLEQGQQLTQRSMQLLAAKGREARGALVARHQGQQLAQPSSITCMAAINQSVDEVGRRWGATRAAAPAVPATCCNRQTNAARPAGRLQPAGSCSSNTKAACMPPARRPQPGATSCLVLGTESGKVLLLNSAGTAVAHSVALGSPPAFLAVAGVADLHHRIVVATRAGRLHLLKNGQPDPHPVHLEAPAVGLVGRPPACPPAHLPACSGPAQRAGRWLDDAHCSGLRRRVFTAACWWAA
jgi:hypothetical protein